MTINVILHAEVVCDRCGGYLDTTTGERWHDGEAAARAYAVRSGWLQPPACRVSCPECAVSPDGEPIRAGQRARIAGTGHIGTVALVVGDVATLAVDCAVDGVENYEFVVPVELLREVW